MSFNTLNLHPNLEKALKDVGYKNPTEIQKQVIPIILNRKDVLACAHTGTGKTSAFVLPILHQIIGMYEQKSISEKELKCIILVPTRELAVQTDHYIRKMSRHTRIKHTVVYGGTDIEKQVTTIRKVRPNILVATPGRFIELNSMRFISLKHIKFFVLDEADKMLDMGFSEDIKSIEKFLPKARQTLLFSATLTPEIKNLTRGMLKNPVFADSNPKEKTVPSVSHTLVWTEEHEKKAILNHILASENLKRVLVFCQEKQTAHHLTEYLKNSNILAEALHGDRSQRVRLAILEEFKQGRFNVLVATDIAARGLHIKNIDLVINYDIPKGIKTYVHRTGRTGRAGESGRAYTFANEAEKDFVNRLIQSLEIEFQVKTIGTPISKKAKKPFHRK